jgi:hypothetical protein
MIARAPGSIDGTAFGSLFVMRKILCGASVRHGLSKQVRCRALDLSFPFSLAAYFDGDATSVMSAMNCPHGSRALFVHACTDRKRDAQGCGANH